MFSPVSARTFRRRALYSMAILLVGTIGFPFLLYFLVKMSSCNGVGGACGALAAMLGIFLKGLLLFVSGGLFVLTAIKRMRGMWAWPWFGFVLAIAWANFPLLFAFGNFWGATFAVGLILMSKIVFVLLLPIVMLSLILSINLESKEKFKGGMLTVKGPWNFPVGYIYCLSALLASFAVLPSLLMFASFSGPAMLPIRKLLYSPFLDGYYASIVNGVAGIVIFLILLNDRSRPSNPDGVALPLSDDVQNVRATFGRAGS